jgi:hypothetical protein
MAAVLALIRQYPISITYEDPRYAYASDLRDVTDQQRKVDQPPPSLRTIVPVGGTLQIRYDVARETGRPVDIASTLQLIVDAQNASPVGGRFAVYQSGETFHVIPADVRDTHGIWIKQQSILDVPITISSEGLDGLHLLDAVLKQVGKASGQTLGLEVGRLINTFVQFRGSVEARDEPSRDVLIRVLHSINPRFTWLLNYDPSDPSGHMYFFNVMLGAEQPSPRTEQEPTPQTGIRTSASPALVPRKN